MTNPARPRVLVLLGVVLALSFGAYTTWREVYVWARLLGCPPRRTQSFTVAEVQRVFADRRIPTRVLDSPVGAGRGLVFLSARFGDAGVVAAICPESSCRVRSPSQMVVPGSRSRFAIGDLNIMMSVSGPAGPDYRRARQTTIDLMEALKPNPAGRCSNA